MDLNIKLEDERHCFGCPMENNGKKCKAGFVRELATIKEETRRKDDIYSLAMYGQTKEYVQAVFDIIRPQTCVLANERAPVAISKILTK